MAHVLTEIQRTKSGSRAKMSPTKKGLVSDIIDLTTTDDDGQESFPTNDIMETDESGSEEGGATFYDEMSTMFNAKLGEWHNRLGFLSAPDNLNSTAVSELADDILTDEEGFMRNPSPPSAPISQNVAPNAKSKRARTVMGSPSKTKSSRRGQYTSAEPVTATPVAITQKRKIPNKDPSLDELREVAEVTRALVETQKQYIKFLEAFVSRVDQALNSR